ncbi:hypothetical protein IQ250_23320, partial [Pseudanabaenaceae cyanobacterium LEGE 13415]|nr:hypothetical protein [Pseudanabaenaceae cyanobacterium LEGE 13415]
MTGFSWLSFSAPLRAAILTQEFEFTIDRLTRPPGETVLPPSAPPLGTRGFGRVIFDTNLIQYVPPSPPVTLYPPTSGYFVRQPLSYSIDFFGNRYNTLPVFRGSSPRETPLFVFNQTETGGYQLSRFEFGTRNESTFISISGLSGSDAGQFSYFGGSGIADGRVTFTRSSEVIPEPTTIAGV